MSLSEGSLFLQPDPGPALAPHISKKNQRDPAKRKAKTTVGADAAEHPDLSQTSMKSVQPLLVLVILATTAASISRSFMRGQFPRISSVLLDFDWNLQDMRLVQLAPDAVRLRYVLTRYGSLFIGLLIQSCPLLLNGIE